MIPSTPPSSALTASSGCWIPFKTISPSQFFLMTSSCSHEWAFPASPFPTMQGHGGGQRDEGAARGGIEAVTCGTVTSVRGGLTMRHLSHWLHRTPRRPTVSADPPSSTVLHDAAH